VLPGTSREELIDQLCRAQARESQATAEKLGVLRALIRDDGEPERDAAWSRSLTHEVSLALAMPPQSADKLMGTAWDLEARLPGIGALLAAGNLTFPKARAVVDSFVCLSDEDAAAAEALIVSELAGKTFSQVEKLAVQAAVTVDPWSAARRREGAERNGARVALRRDPSGAACLAGYDLPTDEALAALASVCARAQQYKDCGVFDGVRMDQFRAMAYLDLMNGVTAEARIAAGQPPAGLGAPNEYGPGDGDPPGESPANAGRADETADDENPDQPGPDGEDPDGEDPDGEDPDGEDPDGEDPDGEDPDGERPDRSGPGGGSPGGDSPGGDSPGGDTPGGDTPGGDTRGDDTPGSDSPGGDSLRGGGAPVPEPPQPTPAPPAPTSPRPADLVIALRTLLGLAERPGEGHGLGPLDPGLCRSLAAVAAGSAHTSICVTVTAANGTAIGHGCARPARHARDPAPAHGPPGPPLTSLPARLNLTVPASTLPQLARPPGATTPWSFSPAGVQGPPGGYGTWNLTLPDGRTFTVQLGPVPTEECDHRHESHAYQPNAALRHLVQVRDYECTFPTCSRHARESDFEHAVPHDKGGRTCACNAGARSRACHQVKQSTGWTVTQPKPGWHQWRTPSGRVYTQGPKRYPA
jgi:hypothetical protein